MPAGSASRHPDAPFETAEHFVADAPHKARAIAALLADHRLFPASILDVGCGTGDVGALLGRTLASWGHPADVAGHEPDPPDRQRLPLVPLAGRWGLVMALDVSEHVRDDIGFLAALRPLADRAIFRLPLDLSVLDVARPHRLAAIRARYGHEHAWDATLATQRVEAAGYRILDRRFDRIPPQIPRGLDALRAAWGARDPEAAARWLGGWSLLVLAAPLR